MTEEEFQAFLERCKEKRRKNNERQARYRRRKALLNED